MSLAKVTTNLSSSSMSSLTKIRSGMPLRNRNGTFARHGGLNEIRRKRRDQRIAYSARKELLKKQLFDKFVNLFFLPESNKDWIPSSSCSGSLVDLYESLIKPSFVLTKRERSAKLDFVFRAISFDASTSCGAEMHSNANLKAQPKVKRVTARRGGDMDNPPSKVWVYPKRRLPLMANHTTEISPVEDWLHHLFSGGYLKVDVPSALSLCMSTVQSYVVVNGKRAYKFFPQLRQASLPKRSSSVARVNNSPGAPSDSAPALCPSALGDDELMDLTRNEPEANGGDSDRIEDTRTNLEPLHSEISDALDLAHDDDSFSIICLLFDEELKHRIEAVAAPFLEKCRSKSIKLMPIIKDVLIYAKEARFGVKDEVAHKKREDVLRCFKILSSRVRDALGLVPYSALRETFL